MLIKLAKTYYCECAIIKKIKLNITSVKKIRLILRFLKMRNNQKE